jgi:hypothetical protein
VIRNLLWAIICCTGCVDWQNVRHSRADGSSPGTMLKNKEQPNLPVSMYPDPEVAPNALVYHINDDIIYKVDIALYNGCVLLWNKCWCRVHTRDCVSMPAVTNGCRTPQRTCS